MSNGGGDRGGSPGKKKKSLTDTFDSEARVIPVIRVTPGDSEVSIDVKRPRHAESSPPVSHLFLASAGTKGAPSSCSSTATARSSAVITPVTSMTPLEVGRRRSRMNGRKPYWRRRMEQFDQDNENDAAALRTNTVTNTSVLSPDHPAVPPRRLPTAPILQEGCIASLPLTIQVGFRRKMFSVFALQLFVMTGLMVALTYNDGLSHMMEHAFQHSGWYLLGTLSVMVVFLVLLYLGHAVFPINWLILAIFSIALSVFISSVQVHLNTNAGLFCCGFTFLAVAIMIPLSGIERCTRNPDGGEDERTLLSTTKAGLAAYTVIMSAAVILFIIFGERFVFSRTGFVLSLVLEFALILWFSYDASTMYSIMSPDEYMSGVIFFYTDLLVVIVIVVIFGALALLFSSAGMGAGGFGGSCDCFGCLRMVLLANDVRRGWRRNVTDVVWTIFFVLRNGCASVALTWVMMFIICLGNIFSGRSPEAQSTVEFTCAILLWMKIFNWFCIAATYAVTLLPQRFTASPDVPPTFVVCLVKVLRGSSRLFLAMGVVTLVVTVALFQGPEVIREAHIEFYVYTVWCQLDTAACHVASAEIFMEETVRGEAKRLATGTRRRPAYWKQLARTFIATFSNVFAFFVTALYAHVMSVISLTTSAQLLVFTLCGFALKVGLQELAKFYTFRQHVQSAVGVAARVSIPTVMVDTQTRVMLLLSPTTGATLSGTLVMAIVEVVFRCCKSYYVAYRIRKEREKRGLQAVDASYRSEHSEGADSTASIASVSTAAPSNQREDFEKWRVRYLHYHAAEVYSDMFAEYIALGCSYVILYFCWGHPKFMLSRFHGAAGSDGQADASENRNSLESVVGSSQAIIIGIQIGAEVVVDYLSCVLELSNGVDLQPLRRHSFFFVVLLMVTAIANLGISTCVFKLL